MNTIDPAYKHKDEPQSFYGPFEYFGRVLWAPIYDDEDRICGIHPGQIFSKCAQDAFDVDGKAELIDCRSYYIVIAGHVVATGTHRFCNGESLVAVDMRDARYDMDDLAHIVAFHFQMSLLSDTEIKERFVNMTTKEYEIDCSSCTAMCKHLMLQAAVWSRSGLWCEGLPATRVVH